MTGVRPRTDGHDAILSLRSTNGSKNEMPADGRRPDRHAQTATRAIAFGPAGFADAFLTFSTPLGKQILRNPTENRRTSGPRAAILQRP